MATALSPWSSARNQEDQPTAPSGGACGQQASSRIQASRSALAPNSVRSRARDTASSRSQAATSGTGINELVGHVVAFSLLATTTTPWPLPPGCRVLLVSLDEYRHWFPGKRADLLAIALDPREGGVHVAAIEVKARRTDEADAASGALDQLTQTLTASRWAAYPVPGSIHTRIWLNRIAEAAYAVARESRFKLDAAELQALEAFRLGRGTLEWAGVGLVFGPKVNPYHKIYRKDVSGDIVPIVLHSIQLTEQLLTAATSVRLAELRTVETDQPPLQSTRVRRRPEAKANGDSRQQASDVGGPDSARQADYLPDVRYEAGDNAVGRRAGRCSRNSRCKNQMQPRRKRRQRTKRASPMRPFARRPARCLQRNSGHRCSGGTRRAAKRCTGIQPEERTATLRTGT